MKDIFIMNKKIIIFISIILILISIIIAFTLHNKKNTNNNVVDINQNYSSIETTNSVIESNNIKSQNSDKVSIQEQTTEIIEEEKIDMIKIKVNNELLEVKLEDNDATKKLVERLKNGDIAIEAKDYGGFEKVGNLGFSLPRSDKKITTSPGDIVLYQGNQLSVFYNSNSWSYTKIGKIQNISLSKLKNILGSDDITLILSLE